MNDVCPVYVDIALLKRLLRYAEAHVWRLNGAGGGPGRLPAYDLEFESAGLWELDTILEWAKRTGREDRIRQDVLAEICQ